MLVNYIEIWVDSIPILKNIGLGLCCLMSFSTIFQIYRGCQFYWWRKLEYTEKTTDLPQVTDKLWVGFELTMLMVIDCTGSCKSNYHKTTTMTVPLKIYIHFILKCNLLIILAQNIHLILKRIVCEWLIVV